MLGWPSGPPSDSVVGDITVELNGGAECNSVEAYSHRSQALASRLSAPLLEETKVFFGFSFIKRSDTVFPITGYEAVCSGLAEIETAMGIGSPISVASRTSESMTALLRR